MEVDNERFLIGATQLISTLSLGGQLERRGELTPAQQPADRGAG